MRFQTGSERSVSRRLKALREQYGYTQVGAAERFGIPVDTWRSWESGRRCPAPYMMRLMELYHDRKGRFLNVEERRELAAAVSGRIESLAALYTSASSEEERRSLSKSISVLNHIRLRLFLTEETEDGEDPS